MGQSISIEYEGERHTAQFEVFEDTLVVYLPDGSNRQTELRGLNAESAALNHLKSYVKKNASFRFYESTP